MEQLRFDRRLIGRKKWITREELEKELEALPDVSHKIATDEDPPTNSLDGETPGPESSSGGSSS